MEKSKGRTSRDDLESEDLSPILDLQGALAMAVTKDNGGLELVTYKSKRRIKARFKAN